MPDSLRFLMIMSVVGGIVYGVAWWLASGPPTPVMIEKNISSDRLRN